jgi:hypothetical protein
MFGVGNHKEMTKITLSIEQKIIQWVFGYPWDFEIQTKYTLPWAFSDINYNIVSNDTVPDFLICVYITPPTLPKNLTFKEKCFFLAGEKHDRYTPIENAFQFCQAPRNVDNMDFTRYVPTMCHWAPVFSPTKIKKCSVVDSGKWEHRNQLIKKAQSIINDIDIFGNISGKPLKGWHRNETNEKFLGLYNYAFYLSLENSSGVDYISEKLWDAILCECVPIYNGAPNVLDYLIEGSFISYEDINNIDWNNWEEEYVNRRTLVLKQKEFIRSHLNVFSYFKKLIDDPNLLNKSRPITL